MSESDDETCPAGGDHDWRGERERYGEDADGNRGTWLHFKRCTKCGDESCAWQRMSDDRLATILGDVRYKDWTLRLCYDKTRGSAPYLQWLFDAPCCKTGIVAEQSSRKWYLSEHMTESELVLTAFKAALTAEEHECRERFTYQGNRVFNPHISVRALMTVCADEDVRDERTFAN